MTENSNDLTQFAQENWMLSSHDKAQKILSHPDPLSAMFAIQLDIGTTGLPRPDRFRILGGPELAAAVSMSSREDQYETIMFAAKQAVDQIKALMPTESAEKLLVDKEHYLDIYSAFEFAVKARYKEEAWTNILGDGELRSVFEKHAR
ncbi:MAG: hypothetical protein HYV90_04220 [Candidatus Woesebacteria bacterium]|nr:MAG: hypothetical protein HYV90_04220 [Candidatus Woesebacteria bacterium]